MIAFWISFLDQNTMITMFPKITLASHSDVSEIARLKRFWAMGSCDMRHHNMLNLAGGVYSAAADLAVMQ